MSKSQQFERYLPSPTAQRKAAVVGFRQKGYVAAKYGRPQMSEEQLRDLGGEAAVRAYRAGLLVGKRERAATDRAT